MSVETRDKRYLDAAIRAADYLWTNYGSRGVYVGATEPQPDPEFGPVLAQWATDSQFRCGSVAELGWHTAPKNPG